MTELEASQVYEIGVSYRYAQKYEWVVHAITGFLSAYYMENPQFRMARHFHELETGMYVWKCEAPEERVIRRLLKRLQEDLPAYQVLERVPEGTGSVRKVIDLPNA